MATIDPSFRRRLLVESLTVLTADPSVQVTWLEGYGVPADEIALDFDNAFGVSEQLPNVLREAALDHCVS
ncbi:hypothetical protein ACLQ18_44240 [Streptomyces sp. DT193]|uniref:hypothetical protein n=1 Tax=Streptomyces sp. DT193 TaxID=3393418 RepID=UPI003CF76A3C